jgi:hypothetical protein
MRINVAIPEAHVSPPVMDAALEATTRLNEDLIRAGEVPTFRAAVNKVRWRPEPPGDEHFDHAGVVLGRGWGDCDDLAPWHAASLRVTGVDKGATAIVKKSGPNRWHAVVRRSNGTIEDPSREAGMGQRANGVMGAVQPLMMHPPVSEVGSYIARPQLALRPLLDRAGQPEAWQARGDLPWHWMPGRSPTDIAMVSLHASPTSSQAIVGACDGAIALGEANGVDDDTLDRIAAIRDLCEGADWEDLAHEYGEHNATAAGHIVHGFFGGLAKLAKKAVKVANPYNLAASAVKHVPGVGPAASAAMKSFAPTTENLLKYGPQFARAMPGVGPVAAQAFEAASPALQRVLLSQRHLPPEAPGVSRCPPGCVPIGFR